MRNIALVSKLSHHKLKTQEDEYPDMQHYLAPDEIPALLRPTTRKGGLNIHVLSLAIIADDRGDFAAFMKALPKDATIISKEDGKLTRRTPIDKAKKLWGIARKRGASVAGGTIRSENAEKEFWEKFQPIKSRWHGKETSKSLLKEIGISHHDTVRVNLGYTRWEWRRLTDAKRERVLKQKEKEYRDAQRNN